MKLIKYLYKSTSRDFNYSFLLKWISLGLLLFPLFSCQKYPKENPEIDRSYNERVKAIHLFARNPIDTFEIEKLKSININSIVLVPFLYQRGLNTDTVISPGKNSYEWTEREEGVIAMAQICNQHNFDLILKPHIWPVGVENGEWRESIFPDSTNWPGWSVAYEKAILNYAKICQSEKIKMLCIGAELKRLAIEKPQYWIDLIEKVRAVYDGKLIYAANWYEEYEQITFWDKLDFIGVQAYFPIAGNDSFDIKYMMTEWEKHCRKIKRVSDKYQKPVLITELGYRSSNNAGVEPWLWDEHWNQKSPDITISQEMQAQCFKVFFETLWQKNWCNGVLIWNWKSPYEKFGGPNTSTFTPQRKVSEKLIAKYFK